MVNASTYDTSSLPLSRLAELLAFEVPSLYEKLLHLKMVGRREEAAILLREVEKYLVVSDLHREESIPMFSSRVDEVWHQFVLFTAQYAEFCARFFGRFMHHEPAEAEATPGSSSAGDMPFDRFQEIYESLFGPIADAWFDERALTRDTRLMRRRWGRPLEIVRGDGVTEIVVLRDAPVVLCKTGLRAEPALQLAMRGEPFHVRELPGLDDVERLALCRALVQVAVLRVAP